MDVNKYESIILGGGMVAGYAAKEAVEGGLKPGQLAIVSADEALPVRAAATFEKLPCRQRQRAERPD